MRVVRLCGRSKIYTQKMMYLTLPHVISAGKDQVLVKRAEPLGCGYVASGQDLMAGHETALDRRAMERVSSYIKALGVWWLS